MTRLFMSYARPDANLAGRIYDKLSRSSQFNVFQDVAIVPGDDFAKRLQSELDSADFVVVLWSINSANSQWVKQEVDRALYAWSESKLVLVKLDQTPLPPGLRDLQAIDLSGRLEKDFAGAFSQLAAALSRAAYWKARKARDAAPPVRSRRMRTPSSPVRQDRIVGSVLATVGILLIVILAVAVLWVKGRSWPPSVPVEPQSNTTLYVVIFALLFIVGVVVVVFWRRPPVSKKRKFDPATDVFPASSNSVFVSFSTKDRPTVDQLIGAMKSEGFSPWIYTGSQDADADRYATRIVRAIKTSRKVAVMCSDHAFQSDEVVRELYVAGKARKPFVAFFLDREPAPDGLPEAFEYFLTGFPFIPVKGRDDRALRSDIRRHLGT